MNSTATASTSAAHFRSIHGTENEVLARAPGRIEFIGNHTDYNGGLVAGAAIDRYVFAAAGKRTDRRLVFASEFSSGTATCELDAREKFEGPNSWANYPLGVFSSMRKLGLRADAGFNLGIVSDLPSGAGLSSSAALELASALAIGTLFGEKPSPEELVAIGRAAENEFLSLPSGPLDQSVCAHGRENRLVFVDCRNLNVYLAPLPPESRILIFNTGVTHSLVDSLYSTRHGECAEILRLLRAEIPELEYLVDAPEFALTKLPAGTPEPLVNRARHVIRENTRVIAARTALEQGDPARVGSLLAESHESSRTLFENSCPELDLIAGLLNDHPHVYGARLSGGGFGGAVTALVSENFGDKDARSLGNRYRMAHGREPEILACNVANGAELVAGI